MVWYSVVTIRHELRRFREVRLLNLRSYVLIYNSEYHLDISHREHRAQNQFTKVSFFHFDPTGAAVYTAIPLAHRGCRMVRW